MVFCKSELRFEPELRIAFRRSDVNVHARFLARKEEEPVRTFAEIVGLTEPMLPRSAVSTAKVYAGQTPRSVQRTRASAAWPATRNSNALGPRQSSGPRPLQ